MRCNRSRPTFGQDLNGDGTVGLKVSTIEAIGTTDFKQVADTYFLYDHGTTTGPQLKMSGAAVTVGQFDTWTPLGAEKMGNGYLAVWKHGAADEYTVWTIDGSGNWLSQTRRGVRIERRDPIARTRLQPEPQRRRRHHGPLCHRGLRIDHPGHHCERLYAVAPTGSSLGPQLRMSGALVTVGQFGAYTPIAAEPVAAAIRSPGRTAPPMSTSCGTLDGSGNWLSQSSACCPERAPS